MFSPECSLLPVPSASAQHACIVLTAPVQGSLILVCWKWTWPVTRGGSRRGAVPACRASGYWCRFADDQCG